MQVVSIAKWFKRPFSYLLDGNSLLSLIALTSEDPTTSCGDRHVPLLRILISKIGA